MGWTGGRFSRGRLFFKIVKTQKTDQQPCAVSHRKPHSEPYPKPYPNPSTDIKLNGVPSLAGTTQICL